MLGKRIANLRRARGLSQSELANKLRLSTSAIGMYEQGRREPSVSIIVALAEELGVTIDYLVTGQTFANQPCAHGEDDDREQIEAILLSTAWNIGG